MTTFDYSVAHWVTILTFGVNTVAVYAAFVRITVIVVVFAVAIDTTLAALATIPLATTFIGFAAIIT